MKRNLSVFGFLVFFGFLFINACKHDPVQVVKDNPPVVDPPIDTLACDSSNVTYPTIVQPILEAYCISCHSGPSPEGALDFDDYNDVAFIAQSGQLLGALKHMDGFEPMPPNQDKLSTCEIALIEKEERKPKAAKQAEPLDDKALGRKRR